MKANGLAAKRLRDEPKGSGAKKTWLATAMLVDRALKPTQLRVGLYMCVMASFGTIKKIAQGDIADDLNMRPNHVGAALKVLKTRGYIGRFTQTQPFGYKLKMLTKKHWENGDDGEE